MFGSKRREDKQIIKNQLAVIKKLEGKLEAAEERLTQAESLMTQLQTVRDLATQEADEKKKTLSLVDEEVKRFAVIIKLILQYKRKPTEQEVNAMLLDNQGLLMVSGVLSANDKTAIGYPDFPGT